jgi:hypothetical protein
MFAISMVTEIAINKVKVREIPCRSLIRSWGLRLSQALAALASGNFSPSGFVEF